MSQPSTSIRFELLALRLGLYGLEGIDPKEVRALARSPQALEMRNLLHMFLSEREVDQMMGRTHPPGCACWDCLMRLHRAARRHREKLNKKAPRRKRRPLA